MLRLSRNKETLPTYERYRLQSALRQAHELQNQVNELKSIIKSHNSLTVRPFLIVGTLVRDTLKKIPLIDFVYRIVKSVKNEIIR
jgi:phage terminase Nu1 subunit (DNA packaging protein)